MKAFELERKVCTDMIQDTSMGTEEIKIEKQKLAILDNIEKKLTTEELEYIEYIIQQQLSLNE